MSPASKSEPNMPPRLSEESLKEVGALSETGTALLRKGRHAQVRRYIFVIYSLWAGSGACYHLCIPFFALHVCFWYPFFIGFACVHTYTHIYYRQTHTHARE